MKADPLREMIESNLHRGQGARVRELFSEINPHLVGDKMFEDRWSDIRKDAAVLVPLIQRTSGYHVVLTVRASDMPSHPGQISFPGGKTQEEDDGPVATALREAHEEVNIAPDGVDVIGSLGIHKGGLGYSVTPVVGVIDPYTDLKPCPREVGEIFEVPLEFIADRNNHITEERTHKGVRYNMFAVPYDRFHIWGLTAGILATFAEVVSADGVGDLHCGPLS